MSNFRIKITHGAFKRFCVAREFSTTGKYWVEIDCYDTDNLSVIPWGVRWSSEVKKIFALDK